MSRHVVWASDNFFIFSVILFLLQPPPHHHGTTNAAAHLSHTPCVNQLHLHHLNSLNNMFRHVVWAYGKFYFITDTPTSAPASMMLPPTSHSLPTPSMSTSTMSTAQMMCLNRALYTPPGIPCRIHMECSDSVQTPCRILLILLMFYFFFSYLLAFSQ